MLVSFPLRIQEDEDASEHFMLLALYRVTYIVGSRTFPHIYISSSLQFFVIQWETLFLIVFPMGKYEKSHTSYEKKVSKS